MKATKRDLFINGEWMKAQHYTSLTSPFSEEVIGEIPSASEAEVNLAIEAAYYATKVMGKMPAHRRASILEKLVSLLEERAEEAARIIALEAAKPITTAKSEVARTIATYKFAAEEAKRIHGETLSLDAAPGGENRKRKCKKVGRAIIKQQGNQQEEEIEVNPAAGTVKRNGKETHIENLFLDAPVSGTIYGALLNYKGSLAALGSEVNEAPYKEPPKAPILYIKPVNTIIGYGMPIPLPSDVPELEVGAALGVVIGRNASRVKEDEAMEYIEGYTVVNDISVPHKSFYRPAISQKARDGFCPVGPWIIERDAVANPDALGIRVFVNGVLRQENNTENLIRTVSRLIADVTDFMTLSAGDMLLVGVPENAPIVRAGDRIRIEIDEVGILENTVLHEDELGTGREG